MTVDNEAFKETTILNISSKVLDNTIPPPVVGGSINDLSDLVKFWFQTACGYVDKTYNGVTNINADGNLELETDPPPANSRLICTYVNDQPINARYDFVNNLVLDLGDFLGQDPCVVKCTFFTK